MEHAGPFHVSESYGGKTRHQALQPMSSGIFGGGDDGTGEGGEYEFGWGCPSEGGTTGSEAITFTRMAKAPRDEQKLEQEEQTQMMDLPIDHKGLADMKRRGFAPETTSLEAIRRRVCGYKGPCFVFTHIAFEPAQDFKFNQWLLTISAPCQEQLGVGMRNTNRGTMTNKPVWHDAQLALRYRPDLHSVLRFSIKVPIRLPDTPAPGLGASGSLDSFHECFQAFAEVDVNPETMIVTSTAARTAEGDVLKLTLSRVRKQYMACGPQGGGHLLFGPDALPSLPQQQQRQPMSRPLLPPGGQLTVHYRIVVDEVLPDGEVSH